MNNDLRYARAILSGGVTDLGGPFLCVVCGTDLGWDRPSGVCSETCLRIGQGFAPEPVSPTTPTARSEQGSSMPLVPCAHCQETCRPCRHCRGTRRCDCPECTGTDIECPADRDYAPPKDPDAFAPGDRCP